jgi:hypothetical protein
MTRSQQRWTLTDALFLGLVCASALPVVLVRYPSSVNYLNHLARLHILAAQPDAPIRQFYEIHWSLIPNLAVDLLWAALHRVASPEAVLKGALIAATVALGLSVWFLHRSLFSRTQPTMLLCAICLLNLSSAVGMINFALGLPLIFLALGCWIRMGGEVSGRSLLLLNALGAAAYFAHIAALAALALTIATYHCLQQPSGARAMLVRAMQLIPGFLLPALLVIGGAVESRQDAGFSNSPSIDFTTTKAFTPVAAFFSGRTATDIATLCATAAIVILCRGPMIPRLKPVLAIWVAVIVVAPSSIGTADLIDTRLAVIPVLLCLSAIAFQPKAVPGRGLAMLAASLVIIRVLILIPSLQMHDAHVRSFRAVDEQVQRGARVIVATATPSGCDSIHSWELLEEHLPSLLSIDRDAFVSTVFAGEGMQPIRWKLNVRYTAKPNLMAPLFTELENTAMYAGWREHYDYLALRDCLPEREPPHDLLLVTRSDTYRIYKVVHSHTPLAARS